MILSMTLTTSTTSPSTDRARRIADAAITLLAERGLRGLTHRAVDAAAGLPEGSTSNHARTRAALLTVALDRLAEVEAAGFDQTAHDSREVLGPREVREQLAAVLAGGLHLALTEGRTLTAARFELALEAGRRPELRARYNSLGSGFVQAVAALLTAAGCPAPDRRARYLVSWCEGILFNATAGAGQANPPSAEDLAVEVGLLLTAVLTDS